MDRRDIVYLKHVLDAAMQIEEYTNGISYDNFMSNKLLQDGIIRQIEIIGEATKNISDILKNKFNNIPWKKISGMRDKLIHNYFGVDLDAVWDTVEKDIPKLKKELNDIIKEIA